jgi:pimeloyl-ACP methyl ester carboxylesterase
MIAELHATAVGIDDRQTVILLNGLADQWSTWSQNIDFWRERFDLHVPELAPCDGEAVHARIDRGEPIDVPFLVERLKQYLDQHRIKGRCHLIASSMGGKTAIEFALMYPERVDRLVLVCPSGLSETETLPIIDGVRRSDIRAVIESIVTDPNCVDPEVIEHYRQRVQDRRWRSGFLRTIRGTMPHQVRDRVGMISQPTLLVVGMEDRVVSPTDSLEASRVIPHCELLAIPQCGHAPQIERADLLNRRVVEFLTSSNTRTCESTKQIPVDAR